MENSKPTQEEWKKVMNDLKNNYGKPQEIEVHGLYYLEHFTNCLPPIIWGDKMVLCSEPYDHNNEGKGLYTGIFSNAGKWFGIITTLNHFKTLI